MAAAIAALYTKDGKLVLSPSELVSGTDYVAVERDEPLNGRTTVEPPLLCQKALERDFCLT